MKNLYLMFAFLAFSFTGFGQLDHYDLNANNTNASVSVNGLFFNNADSGSPGYEVPSGSENHVLYKLSFWFGGRDISGMLKLSAQTYTENGDQFPGPAANGTGEVPVDSEAFGVFPILKSEIDYHIENLGEVGYVPSENIWNWPAHGNTVEGIDFYLAPFVDVNGNGLYEPAVGDYPKIKGDEAVYLIMNDKGGVHESGGDPIGLEIQYLFYQYNSDDFLDNTTFINMRVINRGSQTIYDFRTGCHVDPDIGDPADDYAGFYEANNVMFAYNGDNFDDGWGGSPGFGENPPAIGVVLLNQTPYAFATGAAGGDVSTPAEIYDLMGGLWPGGIPFTEGGNGYGGDTETQFIYNGNPNSESDWSEVSVDNPPGDRRMMMSTQHSVLEPSQILCFDYAVVYGRGENNLMSVQEVIDAAAEAKDFYENDTDPYCQTGMVGLEQELDQETITLFPNPSTGSFQISIEGNYNIAMFSIDGRQVYQESNLNGSQLIQPGLARGTYIVNISQDSKSYPIKLIIE